MLRLHIENILDREEKIMNEQITTLASLTIDGKGSYGIGASAVPFSKDLYTYLRITDIKDDGTLNLQDLKSVDDEKASEYLLKPNDIVFARTGASTGRNYFYDGTDGEFVYAGFLIKFSIDEKKVNPKYIKYFCQSKQYKDWINSFNTGSTRGNINAQTFGKMPIPLIEIKTQDALVSMLSSIDEKIKKNNAINNNLEQQAMALFKSWFIDFEPYNRTVPNNWIEYRLSDFLPVITGKKNANVSSSIGIYPFFSCSQDIAWTDEYSFEGNAILVAGNGDFNVKFYNGKFEAYQRTYVLIPHNPRFSAWLFYAVKYNLNKITASARGSVIKFITKGSLEDFSFYAPLNLDDFDVIDQFTAINDIIASNREENACLSDLKDTLLPKLMSGELDVSKIEI